MGNSSKKPNAPNLQAIAQQQAAQGAQNAQQKTLADRPNQIGPTGSVTWQQGPGGQWTQNVSLSPEQQQLFNAQQGNQQTLAGLTGEQLGGFDTGQVDFSGAPAMPTVGGYDQRAIDTIRALQAPDLARRREAENARLAAMGMGTGSGQAWENAQRAIGDVESRADMNAILQGIQQGNTMFGQGLAARQQGVGETLQQQQANLGKLSGLMGLGRQVSGAPTLPGFMAAAQAPTADLMSAAQNQYKADIGRYNIDRAEAMAPWQMAAQLGSAAFSGPIGGMIGGGIANYLAPKPMNAGAPISDAWYNDSV
jgi:hypothetical protein